MNTHRCASFREVLAALESYGVERLNVDIERQTTECFPAVEPPVPVWLRDELARYRWYLHGAAQYSHMMTLAEVRRTVGIIADDCSYPE